MPAFFQITLFILPFICLYFHIMKEKKRTKQILASTQAVTACSAVMILHYLYSMSGGPDRGKELMQLYLPMAVYILLAVSGLIFELYYLLKYQEKQ